MTLTGIEDALIERLRSALIGRVRDVLPLPGGGGQLVDLLTRNLVVTPGAYLVWSGATRAADAPGLLLQSTWRVLALNRHAAGEVGRRRGDAHGPGAYELVERIASALHDWTLAGVGTCVVTKMMTIDAPAYQDKGISFAACEISLRHPLDAGALPADEQAADLPNFTRFHSDFDLAPPDTVVEVEDDLALYQDP